MKKIVFLALLPFICAGCATTMTPAASRIQAADNNMVSNCLFLGPVQGSSGWGNATASHGMQNARNEAQEQAAKLGATHIVWTNISGGFSPFATGNAYRCKQQ